jgi:hypothetical protein
MVATIRAWVEPPSHLTGCIRRVTLEDEWPRRPWNTPKRKPDEAELIAWSAPGVPAVENHIIVSV